MVTAKRTKKVTVDYRRNCIQLVSGDFRIAVTTEVGPRLIGGFVGRSANRFRVTHRLTNVGQWAIEVAPLYDLGPGDSGERLDEWQGIAGLPEIRTEADVAAYLEPRVG